MVINMQVSPCAVVHNFAVLQIKMILIKMILSSFDLQFPSPTCVIDDTMRRDKRIGESYNCSIKV